MVRRCSKKRYVAPQAATAARQASTASQAAVWKAKASRLRVEEDAGERLLAVAEIVLEVVAVGLEHVEGLVLDLPAGAAAGGQLGDGVGGHRQIGDEAVVIGALARGVADLDGEPVDHDGVGGGAQRHAGEPAVDGGGALAAFADGLAMLFQLGAMQVFGDGLVRGRLAGEDEIAAGLLDGGGDRLAGEQVVAEKDRPQMRHRSAMPGQPALGGVALAVLLLRPVLGGDELRRQRQHLMVARGDEGGAQEGVEVFDAAIGAAACRALRGN